MIDYDRTITAHYIEGCLNEQCLEHRYLYDKGVRVRIENLPQIEGVTLYLEAVLAGEKIIHSVCEEIEPGLFNLSDDLFEDNTTVELFLYAEGPDYGHTIQIWEIPIWGRPEPGRVDNIE